MFLLAIRRIEPFRAWLGARLPVNRSVLRSVAPTGDMAHQLAGGYRRAN